MTDQKYVALRCASKTLDYTNCGPHYDSSAMDNLVF